MGQGGSCFPRLGLRSSTLDLPAMAYGGRGKAGGMGPGRLFFHGKTSWRINSFPGVCVFLVGCKNTVFKALGMEGSFFTSAAGRAGFEAMCQPELTHNLLRAPPDIPLVDWDPEHHFSKGIIRRIMFF